MSLLDQLTAGWLDRLTLQAFGRIARLLPFLALLAPVVQAQARMMVMGDVMIYAVPMPMSLVQERLAVRRAEIGAWNVYAQNNSSETIELTREQITITIAEWANLHKQPQPLFLTRDQAWPIIVRRSGGIWKRLRNMTGVAGAAVAIAGFPPAAAAQPVFEMLAARAANQVPDISTISVELPVSVSLPPHSGVTMSTWSAKMRVSPSPIGPIRMLSEGLSGGLGAQVPHAPKLKSELNLQGDVWDLGKNSVRPVTRGFETCWVDPGTTSAREVPCVDRAVPKELAGMCWGWSNGREGPMPCR